MSNTDEASRARRRESNRRAYTKSKSSQDRLLLRLDKGDLARLDEASHAMGLSRAAFARMFLAPTLSVVASRMGPIETARRADKRSLGQFLSAALDDALAKEAPRAIPSAAADEFDELFGPCHGSS